MKLFCKCGKIATWIYTPNGDPYFCDECVPRGCSCNIIDPENDPLGEEHKDEKGRLYPCCEYDENIYGWDDEQDWIDYHIMYERT